MDVIVSRIELDRRGGETLRLAFVKCPWCGREHVHSAGNTTMPLVACGGPRLGHCARPRDQEYRLTFTPAQILEHGTPEEVAALSPDEKEAV